MNSPMLSNSRLRIAVVAPLTGEVAPVGESAVKAVHMALADLGNPVELMVIDDGCDPVIGKAAVAVIANEPQVIGVVGHYCSVVALAVTSIYANARLPLIIWGAHHIDITDQRPSSCIFRLCGTFRHEARSTTDFALRCGWKRISLLRDATPYGREHASLFREAWQASGGVIVSENEDPNVLGNADVLWIAAAPQAWWKAFKVEMGAEPMARRTTAGLIIAARSAGWQKPILVTAAGLIDNETLDEVGSASGELYALSEAHVPATLQGDGGRFDTRYRNIADAPELSPYARYAYAAAQLMATLIEERAITRERLSSAIAAANGRLTSVGTVAFDHTGQQSTVAIAVFKSYDGHWVNQGLT
jgi:branched-chain amino acid transport system substrate-binding protein